jgi:hypothetical protein
MYIKEYVHPKLESVCGNQSCYYLSDCYFSVLIIFQCYLSKVTLLKGYIFPMSRKKTLNDDNEKF